MYHIHLGVFRTLRVRASSPSPSSSNVAVESLDKLTLFSSRTISYPVLSNPGFMLTAGGRCHVGELLEVGEGVKRLPAVAIESLGSGSILWKLVSVRANRL